MDIETESDDKRLNKLVAVTVVILSVFGAITAEIRRRQFSAQFCAASWRS